MTKDQALARARRVAVATGMSREEVDRIVNQVDRLLHELKDGEVQAMTANGTPIDVPEGDEPLDYLIAAALDEVPVHAFRSRLAWTLRFTALPHRRNAHLLGHPVPHASEPTLEEAIGMATKRPASPAPRTLEEQMAMHRPPQREPDDLGRRLGDF